MRSYGDISILTVSPGTILIRFFLIFPEICASMMCPLRSSTRNIVFGSDSLISPSTSIASSLAKLPSCKILFEYKLLTFLCQLEESSILLNRCPMPCFPRFSAWIHAVMKRLRTNPIPYIVKSHLSCARILVWTMLKDVAET